MGEEVAGEQPTPLPQINKHTPSSQINDKRVVWLKQKHDLNTHTIQMRLQCLPEYVRLRHS